MPNAEQISAWDGPSGEHWAADAERYDRQSRGFGEHIVAVLGPEPTLVHGDAQVHPLPEGSFDAFVSRFGVMFFDDPSAAFTHLARALRPGGRVVFTCWRDLLLNDWIMVPAAAALEHVPMPDLAPPGAPGPFSLADADHLRSILIAAGLTDVALEELVVGMTMGASLDDARDFMHRGEMADALFTDAPPDQVHRAWAAIRDALAPRTTDDGLVLNGAAWLVTARRPT